MVAAQKAVRWEPISGLPDSPCGDFVLESYDDGRLKLTLRYSWIVGNSADLVLNFPEVAAVRTFWDGDGTGLILDRPKCSEPHAQFVWPLLKIENSTWMNGADFAVSMALVKSELPWRHYNISTLGRHADVLARGTITGEWIPASI